MHPSCILKHHSVSHNSLLMERPSLLCINVILHSISLDYNVHSGFSNSLSLSLCLPLFLCVSITLLQGAAVTGLLLMQQNYAIGLSCQKTIFPLYLFFVSFRVYFLTFLQRLMFSCPRSSVGRSLTIASRHIRLDDLITPSSSTGQLTERKQ